MANLTEQNTAVRQDMFSPTWGYAQALRAIGQALETVNIGNFEMTPAGDGYAIQASQFVPFHDPDCDGLSSSHVWATWGSTNGSSGSSKKNSQSHELVNNTGFELQYTSQDIERLEQEGRAKRLDIHGMADASSLSQVLRCIGFYLSQKCVRMHRLLRDGDSFSLEYETSLGSKIKETLGVADLYNFWVRLYLHRADRALQQSEPQCD